MFARFTAVGYLVYPILLLPAILGVAPDMQAWWTPVMAVAVFGSGVVLGAASFAKNITLTRRVAACAAVAYLVAVATALPVWNGTTFAHDDALWLQGFPGLAALAAVIAWPAWVGFTYMVVACVAVQLVNFVMRHGADAYMLGPDIAFAIVFCSLFVGGAVMALRTGRLLDETAEDTHTTAAAAAAQAARLEERERFDGLIHDSVMATLRAGAGSTPHETVQELAALTIAELDDVRAEGARAERAWGVDECLELLRTTAHAVDSEVQVDVRNEAGSSSARIPAEVVRALAAAQGEALRNSVRHAGPQAWRSIRVLAQPEMIGVEVRDDGVGFDPAEVSPRCLGIPVSIRRRMMRVGGWAQVESMPGAGTAVRVGWPSR